MHNNHPTYLLKPDFLLSSLFIPKKLKFFSFHKHMEIDGKQVPGDQKDMTKKNRFEKIRRLPGSVCKIIWKIGRDDPRRAIHALKVGLSLTLVSMLYLLEPLFAGIGKNAIWAVMTVVVVLEFTVGATLSKGLNRGLGTLIAGSLAFFIQYIADESGRIFRAIFIGTAVFIIGFASTYFRFIPYIKKNYDYGVVVFLLTFNLVTVSSYRVDNVMKVAHDRFYTIAIGVGICLVMSLCFFPIWSGEDLHCSTANKLEGLGRSIEACVEEYFEDSEIVENQDSPDEDPVYKEYKAVLDSKNIEEILALQASWEPRSMRRCYKYPWQQYVKLGAVLRQFVYTAVALHGCSRSEIKAPASVRVLFKDPCLRVAREVAKAFMELGDSIRNRRCCSPEILSDNLQEALEDLNNSIESQPRYFLSSNKNCRAPYTPDHPKGSERKVLNRTLSRKESQRRILRATLTRIASISLEFSEALTFAAFAALLVEMVAKLEMVIEQVEKLGKMAKFKEFKLEDIQIIVDDRHKKGSIRSVQTELPPSNDAF